MREIFIKYSNLLLISFLMLGCEGVETIEIYEPILNEEECDSEIINSGKYYEVGDKSYLWAGEDSSTHFDVTGWELNACNLRFGLGREKFNALTDPQYELLKNSTQNYPGTSRAILVRSADNVKVYPLALLKQFETVNEVVDGTPIAIIYCFLIDLATVFNREICGEVLTFGVSGYTYVEGSQESIVSLEKETTDSESRQESFLLWDRNSESLWWPITEVGVSGAYKGVQMPRLSYSKWGLSTISEIKKIYPDALVLKVEQARVPVSVQRTNGCN